MGSPSATNGGEWCGVALRKPRMRFSDGSLMCEEIVRYKVSCLSEGTS